MDKGEPFLWPLLLQFLLILVNAVFACAEIALISLNENKLEKLSSSGNKKAKRLLSLTREPAKFLATIQVGITLAGFLGSAFAADNFSGRLTKAFIELGVTIPPNTLAHISLVAITLILSFLTLVLGELAPKRIAMKNADTLAFAMSGLIIFISKAFAPLVWLLTKSTNGFLRLIGIDPKTEDSGITEEEIRLMIDMGSAKGIIPKGEKELIHNVFEFDNKTAGEVMTHRRDAVLLRLEDSDAEWENTIIANRHSYYPVCDKNPDNITGILNTRDYLSLKDRSRETVLAKALRQAWFIPLTVKTDILFRRMKKNRNHFTVVVDEHGSMMGIVTMSDLLEEIVGDLEDDSSVPPDQPLITIAAANTWYINGAAQLDKVARDLDIILPLEKYDTFAGFVFSLLGQIPEDGSEAELDAFGLKIKILEVREHRLEKALVIKEDANA
ncbi:hemolysin family protein [Leadbettera azotonutricia]|uniref:Transporter, HlyC/CorC family n=1 Tax=Leadbettera azotonutricia (strain ATCC BAA-888 / DSM 13862 / ZAS-9) TaxID=545695 RepID=F5YF28_LEAAZ|nr:hemolysin family protein [Leadbettera azotonutricia]AEF81001.1 transporter, HlyC/CorC family [Leadbettera azotonutricia ZAS-9]